jgi:hypothetical protein
MKNQRRITFPWRSLLLASVVICFLAVFLMAPDVLGSHLITGSILALFLPGACIVRLLPRTLVVKSTFERLGWSVLGSFLLFGTVLYVVILASGLTISRDEIEGIVLAISTITALVSYLIKPVDLSHPEHFNLVGSLVTLLPLAITSVAIFLPYAVNPFAQNNDGFLSKTLVYAHGGLASLNDLRPVFPASLAALSTLTDVSVFKVFLFTPPVLFLAGTLCFWGYIRREIPSWQMRVASLLTLISAPVIVTEIATTRPQVILLAFTIPLLLLGVESIRARSIYAAATGLVFSVTLVPFHELAVTLVLTFLVICGWLLAKAILGKKISSRNCLLALVIALPYLYILHLGDIFSQALGMVKYIAHATRGLTWRWWFINSYTDVDGAQLGWPGVQAAYYYLYNGLLLYIVILTAWVMTPGIRNVRAIGRSPWMTPISFITFFFFFAEIAPRLGFYFLLNRTWPYIALAICVCCIPVFKEIEHHGLLWVRKLVFLSMIFVACTGIAGTFKVARDNVSEVFPEEAKAINYLAALQGNALVLSNQNNQTLVSLYAGKSFATFPSRSITTQVAMNNLINQEYRQATTSVETVSETELYSTKIDNDKIITQTTSPTYMISRKLIIDPENGFRQAYFFYSKRKAGGEYAERTQEYHGTDAEKLNIPAVLKHYPIVFQDNDAIIYRLPNPQVAS